MTDQEIHQAIEKQLQTVYEPQLMVDVYNLGLIYDIAVADGHCQITMTLPSMGCGCVPQVTDNVQQVCSQVAGITETTVKVVWEPAWTPAKMNRIARITMQTNRG